MGLKDYLKNLFGNGKARMDECMQVLDIIDTVLDEEATADEQQILTSHIKSCMPCYEKYNLDKSIKELLKARRSDKPVPEGLVNSIKLQISQSPDIN